jgi:hypothetical protein
LTTIRILLELDGHAVEAVDNSRAGLRLLETKKFDLLIVDIFMPGMDGFETMGLVRQGRPEMPIIVISGNQPWSVPNLHRIFSTWPQNLVLFRLSKSPSDPMIYSPPLPGACQIRRRRPSLPKQRKEALAPTDLGLPAGYADPAEALMWRARFRFAGDDNAGG